MQVLNDNQILQKIKRLSYEILEQNLDDSEIILAGINNNGYKFAQLLSNSLKLISDKPIKLTRIILNPAQPVENPITIELSDEELIGKSIIVIDDVANTGRTIFYAFKVFINILVKKVEVAVLVDRTHKLFPIKVDYVGLSLATTVQENINANLTNDAGLAVTLN